MSLLYRMASLARALKVSVTDALRLVAMTGVAPLRTASAAPSPIDTLAFPRSVRRDRRRNALRRRAGLSAAARIDRRGRAGADDGRHRHVARVDQPQLRRASSPPTTERITAELKASLTQSLGSALGVDPAVLDAVVFTHRAGLGDELLTHVIVAANLGAAGLPTPRRDFATVFGQLHKFGLGVERAWRWIRASCRSCSIEGPAWDGPTSRRCPWRRRRRAIRSRGAGSSPRQTCRRRPSRSSSPCSR